MVSSFDLSTTYVHLDDQGRASPIAVSPKFWQTLEHDQRLGAGRLMGAFKHVSPGAGGWERHPAGDELLCLLYGKMIVVVETTSSQARHELIGPGAAYVVPRGLWHSLVASEPCSLLFITPGAGTEHR